MHGRKNIKKTSNYWFGLSLLWTDFSKTFSDTSEGENLLFFFIWCNRPQWAKASSFTRFLDHTQDAQQSVGLLWTSDQPVAKASTWQHTTITTDKHPCLRRDSKPQSQQASGRRPTP